MMRKGIVAGADTKAQAAMGATFLLWCFVATHGKGEPGLGVKADGQPLPLVEMASECCFDGTVELSGFLDQLAELGHIHLDVWQQKQVVFLPAMWQRVSGYYRSKGRKGEFKEPQQVADMVLAGPVRAGRSKRAAQAALQDTQDIQDQQDRQTEPADLFGHLPTIGEMEDQVDAVIRVWNEERKPGPKVSRLTGIRKARVLVVLREYPNLEDWRTAIRWLNGQDWCNASGRGDHPNWRADLDYLIRPGRFTSVMERQSMAGAGHRRGGAAPKAGKFSDL